MMTYTCSYMRKWGRGSNPAFVLKLANGSLAYIIVLPPSTPAESRGAITVVSGRRPRATRPPVNILALRALISFSSSLCWLCSVHPLQSTFWIWTPEQRERGHNNTPLILSNNSTATVALHLELFSFYFTAFPAHSLHFFSRGKTMALCF